MDREPILFDITFKNNQKNKIELKLIKARNKLFRLQLLT